MINEIVVMINGSAYANWTDARVTRSMENLTSSFSFTTTQHTPFKRSDWNIKMGVDCQVLVDGELLLAGWIEDIDIDYGNDAHTVHVAGRDFTCDITDCHKSDMPDEGYNKTIVGIIKDMMRFSGKQIFDIGVVVDPSATDMISKTPIRTPFLMAMGEPLLGILHNICSFSKLYVISSRKGEVVITGVGSREAGVVLGEGGARVLVGGVKESDKELYSEYWVRGFGPWVKDMENLDRKQIHGRWPPPGAKPLLPRHRPYAQMAEIPCTGADMKNRGEEEARYRIGTSRKFNYTVQGWREKPGGNMWDINTLVYVNDPYFGLSGRQLLIESVDYLLTDEGTLAQLRLCDPMKYSAKAEISYIKSIMDGGMPMAGAAK